MVSQGKFTLKGGLFKKKRRLAQLRKWENLIANFGMIIFPPCVYYGRWREAGDISFGLDLFSKIGRLLIAKCLAVYSFALILFVRILSGLPLHVARDTLTVRALE